MLSHFPKKLMAKMRFFSTCPTLPWAELWHEYWSSFPSNEYDQRYYPISKIWHLLSCVSACVHTAVREADEMVSSSQPAADVWLYSSNEMQITCQPCCRVIFSTLHCIETADLSRLKLTETQFQKVLKTEIFRNWNGTIVPLNYVTNTIDFKHCKWPCMYTMSRR